MLHKNYISDEGASAIGQLLVNSPNPVQEVHLSHNDISEHGVCSMLDAVQESGRYPYDSGKSSRKEVLAALWLRIENNVINIKSLERLLDKKIPWSTATSNDRWKQDVTRSMVCFHKTYT